MGKMEKILIYFKACQLHTKDKDVQVSILLHIIGEQCREVNEHFAAEGNVTVESLPKKYDAFFTPKKNLTVERHKFFIRNQQEYESVKQYAFELNKLALSCEFKDLKDDLVKDRLICGLRDDSMRERLLREYDLTLRKALDICNVAEMSRVQARIIKTEQDGERIDEVRERDRDTEVAMHWVQRQQHGRCGTCQGHLGDPDSHKYTPARGGQPARNEQRTRPASALGARPASRAQPQPRFGNSATQRQRGAEMTNRGLQRPTDNYCDYCGSVHERFKCPAYGQRCAKCKRLNHFARVCRVHTVHQENAIDQVRSYTSASNDWCIDLQINNNTIKFKLDTGADVNVLPYRFLSKIGIKESDLITTNVKLVGYSGGNIKVLGKCRLKCTCKKQTYIIKFIIADVVSPPVLGKRSCEEMKTHFNGKYG